MVNDQVYLKNNVMMEPLFNQWYAWPYLIPPASAAMYIVNSHLKTMQSFVSAPQVHTLALKNPAMLGGPVINHGVDKAGEIEKLIHKTKEENTHMLEFAEATKALENLLISGAHGYSLESYYSKIPDVLKGYVELVYDLDNNPSVRFIEGLLYKSKYYTTGSQSIFLSEIHNDSRSFVFSTPRLKSDGGLFLNIPFSHEGIDELFGMRDTALSYNYIKERLQISRQDENFFASLFTAEKPLKRISYQDEGLRIRYYGHACVLLETRDISILVDPVISYKYDNPIYRYTLTDLPEHIDYALITHNHPDHLMFETMLQLRHKIKTVIVPKGSGASRADPSVKLLLQAVGFNNVREIDEMESIGVEGGMIMGVPFLGEHADLNIRSKTAYYIDIEGRAVLLAADSNNLETKLYDHIYNLIDRVDILFLGMECDGAPLSWLYGPLFNKSLSRKDDQSRRFDGSNYEKAIAIVDLLKPREVYVYAMGQEPWCTFLTSIQYTSESRPIVDSNRLIEECMRRDVISERLYGHKEIRL